MRIVRHKFHELRPRYLLRIEQAKLDRRDAFNEGQRQELVKFVQKEKSVLGRMANRFSTISFSTLLENKNGERSTLRHAFECLTSSAARVEAFKERQRREGREFEKELARSGRLMEKKLQAGFCGRLNRIRQSWREERVNLLSLHRDEKTKLELLWSHRHEERGKAYRVFGPKRDVTDENVNLTPKHPPHQVETRYQTLKREREEFLASRRENNRDRGRTRGLDE